MPVSIATNHFLAKEGLEKKNCAQAILCAFQEEFQIPQGLIESFKEYGGGRAPDGICGAVYAAEFILGIAGVLEDDSNVVSHIQNLAGSAKCKEIKSHKKLSCLGCVEQCTSYISDVLN